MAGACATMSAMPDPTTLLVFAAASLALLVVPGPAVFYIVTRSMADGRRAGAVSMLGVETGGLVHVAAAALGLSALLASSVVAFSVVKYLGAVYLVYLGVRQLLRPPAEAGDTAVAPASTSRLFWQGALVQVLNPKVGLFFLAFLPQFIDPAAPDATLAILALGLWFNLSGTLVNAAVALAAARAAGSLKDRPAVVRLARWFAATAMAGLAVQLALSRAR